MASNSARLSGRCTVAVQFTGANVTLLASCQLHGLEPLGYLRDLLCLLPGWPVQRVLELAPVKWTANKSAAGQSRATRASGWITPVSTRPQLAKRRALTRPGLGAGHKPQRSPPGPSLACLDAHREARVDVSPHP